MGRRAGLFLLLSNHVHVGHDVALIAERIDSLGSGPDISLTKDVHQVACERGPGHPTHQPTVTVDPQEDLSR